MKKYFLLAFSAFLILGFSGCKNKAKKASKEEEVTKADTNMVAKVNEYKKVKLTTDLSVLSEKQKQMLPILFKIADIMDEIFWIEAYGNKTELLESIEDEATKKFVEINYGPWSKLDNNEPFISDVGEKPKGANFYPADITQKEFDAFEDELKNSQYTLLRRDEDGNLMSVPYHEVFREKIEEASQLLMEASEFAENEAFREYLIQRSEALRTDEYQPSDFAWLAMKDNIIDFVVGPIENYEDELFNIKAAHESFILIKDMDWSNKLKKYIAYLPELQETLPVDKKYKSNMPGTSGNQLNAYDVIYYAGDCNKASKTIAINLPNDPIVRQEAGSRKLMLKNAMKAKFDNILLPISNVLIDESQRKNVKFDAFFANTMFHEVGHGLGVDYLVNNPDIKVRDALKSYYTAIEEGKADIVGLHLITYLYGKGELDNIDLMDYYVTFFASVFRSARFGSASSHGKANMMRFYFFEENNAFTRDEETGTYTINFDNMKEAVKVLAEKIITIQGDGNYEVAKAWVEKDGKIKDQLQADLDRLADKNIPRDIIFEQGYEVLIQE
ncbi:MAG: Zn-dependent hydrolase [Bacteroidota bacterium]|nr:Zn-dependent hydrolase [Bacteroidota bacterium]